MTDDRGDSTESAEFDALRELRLEGKEFDEEVEFASEHVARAARRIEDILTEHLFRGDTVRVAVGRIAWTGIVVHVRSRLLSLRLLTGSEVDIDVDGLTALQVVERAQAGGTARGGGEPASLVARLRELERTGEPVTLGGRWLEPDLTGAVEVVARDHVEFRRRDGSDWVVPLREVTHVIRDATGLHGR